MTLTPRETSVLKLLKTGKRGTECATELGIKIGTWKVYASRVYQKTGFRRRLELIESRGLSAKPTGLMIPCSESFRECDYTFQ